MSATLVLLITSGVLLAAGVTLLLERALSRVLLGLLLMGNAVNLLIIATGGPSGAPPMIGADRPINDPLPQAMILTAIVIMLGLTAFLLATAHRSWQLSDNDDVQDDIEDRRLILASDAEPADRASERDRRARAEDFDMTGED